MDASAPDLAHSLDVLTLNKLRALDPQGTHKLLDRVVVAFLNSLDKLLPELDSAPNQGRNLAAVRHVAHTLKSSSASLGARRLSELCAELESQARGAHTESLDKLIDAMHDEATRVRAALGALLTETQ